MILIHWDCQVTIARDRSKIYNGKNKHIRMRHNIVKQLLELNVVSLDFVRSTLNLTDLLTKPLNKNLIEITSKGMGLLCRSKDKSDGNPTYVIKDPMKYICIGT